MNTTYATVPLKAVLALGLLMPAAQANEGTFNQDRSDKIKGDVHTTVSCQSTDATATMWTCSGTVLLARSTFNDSGETFIYGYCYNPNGSPNGSFRPLDMKASKPRGHRGNGCYDSGYGNDVELKIECNNDEEFTNSTVVTIVCAR